MTEGQSKYADYLLEWSRTLPEHKLPWEEWLVRKHRGTR